MPTLPRLPAEELTVSSGVCLLLTCIIAKALKINRLGWPWTLGKLAEPHAMGRPWSINFFNEDVVACAGWLLASRSLVVRLSPTSRGCAAVVVALQNLLALVVAIADAVYFRRMGESLELQVLQLAFGAHAQAMLMAALTQYPFAVVLLPAVVLAYALILAICSLSGRRLVLIALLLARRGAAMRGRCDAIASTICASAAQRSRRRLMIFALIVAYVSSWMLVLFGGSVLPKPPTRRALLHPPAARAGAAELPRKAVLRRLRRNILVQLAREAVQQCTRQPDKAAQAAELPLMHASPALSLHCDRPSADCGAAAQPAAAENAGATRRRAPDVVLVVLEGVRYRSLPTALPLRPGGLRRSGALERLRQAGMLVHAPQTYTSIPNTLKATYAMLCGTLPEPPQSSDFLREFAPTSALLERCLPRVLRRTAAYDSTFLTSSNVVDAVHGQLGFDRYEGYASQVGGWRERIDAVGSSVKLPHGSFERVNWLGYDDFSTLQPAVDALDSAKARSRPAFVTLFTVGTHSRYGLPSHVSCNADGTISRDAAAGAEDGTDPEHLAGIRANHALAGAAKARWLKSAAAKRLYECAVAYSEAYLEALAERLSARDPGLANTLLVVVGDHGEAFGEHGSVEHGTSLFPEETRVPLMLAGGPIRRALASGALRVTPALGPMAIRGAHRLEDLVPTVLDVVAGSGVTPPPSVEAAAEAEHTALYAALAQLGLGGRSMLWASRQPAEAAGRALLLHTMFGARKVGLVYERCGALRMAAFTYDGCGECELLEGVTCEYKPAAAADAALSTEPYHPTESADDLGTYRELLPGLSAFGLLSRALQLLAAVSTLHRHMREAPYLAPAAAAWTNASAPSERLKRANALLRAWLAAGRRVASKTAAEVLSGSSVRLWLNASTEGVCSCRTIADAEHMASPEQRQALQSHASDGTWRLPPEEMGSCSSAPSSDPKSTDAALVVAEEEEAAAVQSKGQRPWRLAFGGGSVQPPKDEDVRWAERVPPAVRRAAVAWHAHSRRLPFCATRTARPEFELAVAELLARQHAVHAVMAQAAEASLPRAAGQRYLICQTGRGPGLGNLFHGLLSCLLVAMLTERAVLIDWADYEGYVFSPRDPEGALAMPPWPSLFRMPGLEWHWFDARQAWPSVRALAEGNASASLEVDCAVASALQPLWTSDLREVWRRYEVVRMSHLHQSLLPLLIGANPYHTRQAVRWFDGDAFQQLFCAFLRPAPEVQRDYDAAYSRLLAAAKEADQGGLFKSGVLATSGVLGLHLRTVAKNPDHAHASDRQQLLECALRVAASRGYRTIYVAADSAEARAHALAHIAQAQGMRAIMQDVLGSDANGKTYNASRARPRRRPMCDIDYSADPGGGTCGGRIKWLMGNRGMTEAEARLYVSTEFPAVCMCRAPPDADRQRPMCDIDYTADPGGGTCGSRIEWLMGNRGMTEAEARLFVSTEFPMVCMCRAPPVVSSLADAARTDPPPSGVGKSFGTRHAAFVEMLLLASCADLVVHERSAFSSTAYGAAGLRPYMNAPWAAPCSQQPTPAPCAHAYKTVMSRGTERPAPQQPHADLVGGIKLTFRNISTEEFPPNASAMAMAAQLQRELQWQATCNGRFASAASSNSSSPLLAAASSPALAASATLPSDAKGVAKGALEHTLRVSTVLGVDMLVHSADVDTSVSASIARDRAYGKLTSDFLAAAISDSRGHDANASVVVALDIGANVGYHTLQMARLGARVVAWECMPSHLRLLEYNARASGLGARIHVVPRAASNRSASLFASTTPRSPGATSLGSASRLPWAVDGGALVNASRAADELRALGVHRASVLKLDVEGHEIEALAGLGPLRALGLRRVAVEFFPPLLHANGHAPAELLHRLDAQGFDIHAALLGGRVVPRADFEAFAARVEATGKHTDLFCYARAEASAVQEVVPAQS